ncbi:hypothetical protein [Streptomyces sp. SD15]
MTGNPEMRAMAFYAVKGSIKPCVPVKGTHPGEAALAPSSASRR